jgi:hypothetical protein
MRAAYNIVGLADGCLTHRIAGGGKRCSNPKADGVPMASNWARPRPSARQPEGEITVIGQKGRVDYCEDDGGGFRAIVPIYVVVRGNSHGAGNLVEYWLLKSLRARQNKFSLVDVLKEDRRAVRCMIRRSLNAPQFAGKQTWSCWAFSSSWRLS